MKTNRELVAYVTKALSDRWVYWYGTTGVRCSGDLLTRKTAQYPEHYTSSRMPTYKQHISEGRSCADCVNLVKGFMWLDEETGKQKYGSNGCPDTNADGMYNRAVEKGDISTLPEIPGIMLHLSGHAGVYIGNGYAIEARGFSFGVVKTAVKGRGWRHWYKMPGLVYADEAEKEPVVSVLGQRTLRRGCKGDDVTALQQALMDVGYELTRYGADGDFGAETEDAVKLFQRREALEVDGVYGSRTHEALMAAVVRDDEEDELIAQIERKQLRVTGASVYVRTGAGTGYSVLTIVHAGDKLPVITQDAVSGWYAVEINGKTGWITNKYTTVE